MRQTEIEDDAYKLWELVAAARKLSVPTTWLRERAEAGDVPCLRAGRKFLFFLPALKKRLAEMAGAGEPHACELELTDSRAVAGKIAEHAAHLRRLRSLWRRLRSKERQHEETQQP